MNAQLEQAYRSDLEIATTIGFFETRVGLLREIGAELPNNIDYLRQQTVQRNIQKIEADIGSASQPEYKAMRQKELDGIKREYAYLLR